MQNERYVVNLTRYTLPTIMRVKFGVFDLPTNDQKLLEDIFATDFAKHRHDYMTTICDQIAEVADNVGATRALIDPPPFMCACLERSLFNREILPMYAISRIERYQEGINEKGNEEIKIRFMIDRLIEAQNHYKLEKNPFNLLRGDTKR